MNDSTYTLSLCNPQPSHMNSKDKNPIIHPLRISPNDSLYEISFLSVWKTQKVGHNSDVIFFGRAIILIALVREELVYAVSFLI